MKEPPEADGRYSTVPTAAISLARLRPVLIRAGWKPSWSSGCHVGRLEVAGVRGGVAGGLLELGKSVGRLRDPSEEEEAAVGP